MKLSMLSKKAKIIIIAGVSVSVLAISLGLGLGLGLKGTESVDYTKVRLPNGRALTDKELSQGYFVGSNNKKYSFLKLPNIDDEWVVSVGDIVGKLSPMNVFLPSMFGKYEIQYKDNKEWGKGKKGYYDIPFMHIGAIKVAITKDGVKIYGGFKWDMSNNTKTGASINTKLSHDYPNGYEIGSFNKDGNGGINMLKLQNLKHLLDDDSTTGENTVTTTTFRLFPHHEEGKDVVRLATLDPTTTTNGLPSSIGVKPNLPLINNAWPANTWGDDNHKPSLAASERNDVVNFEIREFKKRDGSIPTIALPANIDITASKGYDVDVNLADLYYPISVKLGRYVHPIWGVFPATLDGSINFPSPSFSSSGIVLKDGKLTIKGLKYFLRKSKFNIKDYATAAKKRNVDELLISVEKSWLPYFQKIANDPIVKQLAQENSVTIRFKVGPTDGERNYISTVSVSDNRAAEVFFFPADATVNFNTRNQLAPLKYDLLKNLENKSAFTDSWRLDAKIVSGNDKDKYGMYPFNTETQIIAYNKDFLPNGLDFKSKPLLADHLTQTKINVEANDVKYLNPNIGSISDDHKKGLLMAGHLVISGPAWAFDYYNKQMVDQIPNQQDIIWKRKTPIKGETSVPKNAYWTPLVDPGLKDDKRFIKFVNHYKNAPVWHQNDSAQNKNDIRALFNGYVGAIVIGPWWIDSDWKMGNYRHKKGTDFKPSEKKDFAENHIGFQSVPIGLANGWYSAMVSTLKSDPKKQKVAERFLSHLLDPTRAEEFAKATTKITARKDATLVGANKIIKGYFKAISSTITRNRLGGLNDKIWAIYNGVVKSINGKATIESVAAAFKKGFGENQQLNALPPREKKQ